MKFRCERDVLVEALSTTGRAVPTRDAQPRVLSGVRMQLTDNTLQLTGSDLDLTIQTEVQVAGKEDGVVVVRAKLAADVVRALDPGAVDVSAEDDQLMISSNRSEFSLRLLPAEEFPRHTEPLADEVTLDATSLAEAIRQVGRAASGDDLKPVLTGVHIEAGDQGLRLVATDSYRLALRDLPGNSNVLEQGQSVLVPSRALAELARMLKDNDEVTLRLGDRDARFSVAGGRLTTRLIEGDFPNYRGLLPSSYPNKVILEREALLDSVKRVRLLAQEKQTSQVRLVMSPEGLELMAVTPDVGEAHERLDAKYEGDELTVAFNADYLIDGIDAVLGDEVSIETLDALKPAVLRSPEQEEFLYLLMPVRVS